MSDAMGPIDEASASAARSRVVELEAVLAAERAVHAELEAKHDRLLGAYQALQHEIELVRRRLFVAKAERVDTAQLELEFAAKLATLDALAGQLVPEAAAAGATGDRSAGDRRRARTPPTGRRPLRDAEVPEERIELPDPTREGNAERIGSEDSSRMMWRRAGYVRVVTSRIKYRDPVAAAGASDADATVAPLTMARIFTAPLPPEMIDRSFGTPSLWAHIASDKFCDGLPLFRQEDRFARAGFRIDRGTLSRWLQDLGLTVGATVVEAMRDEAMRTAFCIATDATGILVQPIRTGDKKRQPCQRGHFFVQIADADHVFFEYTPRETSAAIGEMFRGFSGYVQADAKSVYDFLYRPPDERTPDDGEPDLAVRSEVGCWSHARRPIWETAIITKDVIAREGLARIARIFALDRTWRGRPHPEIKALREAHLRPHVTAFFEFVDAEYQRVKEQRGMLRSALGYSYRQQGALTKFFEDGRLRLTNNESERELRRVATWGSLCVTPLSARKPQRSLVRGNATRAATAPIASA